MEPGIEPRFKLSGFMRLIVAFAAWLAASIACFMFWIPLFETVRVPLAAAMAGQGVVETKVVFGSPQEAFLLRTRVAAVFGLIVSVPIVAYNVVRIWISTERVLRRAALASTVLFLAGAGFALFVYVPGEIERIYAPLGEGDFGDLVLELSFLAEWTRYALFMMSAFGLALQIPLLLFLWKYRKRTRQMAAVAKEV